MCSIQKPAFTSGHCRFPNVTTRTALDESAGREMMLRRPAVLKEADLCIMCCVDFRIAAIDQKI